MANAKFIIGETGGQIDLSISPTTPSAPSSGYVSMWTDGAQVYMVNSAGDNIVIGEQGTDGATGATGATGTGGVIALYGSFASNVSQTNAGATAANAVTYNVTDFANGISIVDNSKITIANGGTYDIQFSFQVQKNSGGDDSIDIWLSKNGSNVADSNTRITLSANPAYEVAAWNFLVQANAGDYYQIYWSSADTTMELHASAAGTNPTRPAIPSVILSVAQVTYTQTGATGASGSSGSSGTSGTSGVNGSSGATGSSGTSGTSGTNGATGAAGPAGATGAAGTSGSSGSSGVSGSSGSSGTSGVDGSSGAAGSSGTSGTSGINGATGATGSSGTSGTSGINGATGAAGTSGSSGSSGTSGSSGSSGTSGVSGTSGSSGSSGVSGSSGSSGTSGTSGVNGATGPAGATGAGASSPITLQQTNSLVSTAIGATATASEAIVIGATACATTNSIVIGRCASAAQGSNTSQLGGIVIGNGACLFGASTDQSIAIGQNACAQGTDAGINRNSVAIGPFAVANTNLGGLAVGPGSIVTGDGAISVGYRAQANSVVGMAIGWDACVCSSSAYSFALGGYGPMVGSNSECALAFGHLTTVCSTGAQAIGANNAICSTSTFSNIFGNCNTIFPGATGQLLLGRYSVGSTGSFYSMVIGNCQGFGSNPQEKAIILGNDSSVKNTGNSDPMANNIVIGNSLKICTGNNGNNNILIGDSACIYGNINCSSVVIGSCARSSYFRNVVIGPGASMLNDGSIGVAIGSGAQGSGEGPIVLGYNSTSAGYSVTIGLTSSSNGNSAVSIGYGDSATCSAAIAIGRENTASAISATAIGYRSTANQECTVAMGCCAVACHTGAYVFGSGLTSEKTDTTHVNSLIAYGQGVSKFHNIGSAGGTVTVNWDNANDQGITLTSSISSLTFSNAISGANYLLKLTQGGSGSYTVTWPGAVTWLNGAPILQTSIGGVDIVSFFYDGTTFWGARAPQDGATGPAGAAGVAGPTGPTGAVGATGPDTSLVLSSTKTAGHTFALADAYTMVIGSSASDINFTVPLNSTTAFPTGSQILVTRGGTGGLGITGAVGVTINSANGYQKLNFQYSGASLIKQGTDTWYLFGDLKP